jgi:hypothetical protein
MLKNIFISSFICLVVILSTAEVKAQSTNFNNNMLIGKAHSVPGLPQLLAGYQQGNSNNVWSSVYVTGSCFAEGFMKTVNFIVQPIYVGGPETDHPPALPIVIATVNFDCYNDIIGYTLY